MSINSKWSCCIYFKDLLSTNICKYRLVLIYELGWGGEVQGLVRLFFSFVPKSTNLLQANSLPILRLSVMSVTVKEPTESPAMMSFAVCRTLIH